MIKMQNDYLNNRYYCDNNNNFLELRKLIGEISRMLNALSKSKSDEQSE